MKKLIYLVMAAVLIMSSCAEDAKKQTEQSGSIYGVITNKATGEPMRASGVELYTLRDGVDIKYADEDDIFLLTKTVTGDDGHYEFKELNAGYYFLSVTIHGYADILFQVSVEGGKTAKGDMQLVRTITDVYGTITTNGKPVESAVILLTPGGGTKITDSDGKYNFSELQPGRYELKVFKEGFQSFNKSIDLAGKDEELVISLSANTGKLTLNKAYVDMGSNEGNNVAGFSVLNKGDAEISWKITNAARWITKIDPESGSLGANVAAAVVFTIDRSKLSSNTSDNYATLVASSPTDGSTAELLVTVFGIGDGTNTTITNGENYVTISGLMIQTQDGSGDVSWESANNACESSNVGGFDDWRLPTIGELSSLYINKKAIGGFNLEPGSYYWSSTVYSSSSHNYINFYSGTESFSSGNCRCRCVRKSSPIPVVTTLAATNIAATTATLNGKIDKKGEPPYTERGFVYSNTFQNPIVEDDASTTTKRVVSGTSTDFSTNVAGLTSETTYYVRAYATNSNGTVYGESISFKPTDITNYVVVLQSEGIMVQKNDISSGVTHGQAQSLCESSKVAGFSDWRLPTFSELKTLYNQRTSIGGFSSNGIYWSSTLTYGVAWYYYVNFGNGDTPGNGQANNDTYGGSEYRVRAVRTLP